MPDTGPATLFERHGLSALDTQPAMLVERHGLLALYTQPAMLVERHGLFAPDYQNHSHDKAHVNNTYVQFQGLNEACIKYTYIQLQGLNGAHVNYTYFQSICWHETQVQFTNFMEIRSAILSKALPSLPSICWMVLNALLEYVHLSIHYILCNCILAYLCLNDAPSQLCVALWCRFQQHCMLKHEYSNLITVALK